MTGITSSEKFQGYRSRQEKRIIVLASTNIQIGWQTTIYNPEKGDNQCTGDTYELPRIVRQTFERSRKTIPTYVVRKYYELHGYAAFAK